MAQLNDLVVTGSSRFLQDINGNILGTSSNVTGTVAVAHGGTGATTAANARANLGTPYMVTESYPALVPTNGSNNWIKIGTANSDYGLLPSQAGNRASGHNYIGTSSWYWKYAYIDEIYAGTTLKVNGTAVSLDGHTHSYAGSSSAGGAATSLANFENNNSTAKNANDVTYNAHTYYTSNGPAQALGASTNDGALYCQAYSTSWVSQIAQDYRNGNLYTRGKNNGTWQRWRKVRYSDDSFEHSDTVYLDSTTNKVTVSKSTSAWDAQLYSKDGYADNVFVTFKANQTNMAMMIGLDSNPSQDASYGNIDYCIYCMNNGKVSIYESNTERSVGAPSYAVGDEFRVEYSGGYIRYYQNGTLLREVARSISGKLYLDSSFHGASSCIYDLYYGPCSKHANHAVYSNTVLGIYTGNGGVQAPNYFGKNRVGFLMSNVTLNNDSHYKNIMYMDNYSGNDVGGVTALAIDRMEARAWILQSDSNRTAWNNTAELITSANIGSQAVNYATGAGAATSATTASKLSNTSKIGDTNKPVYFTANGVPAAISYTIEKSVPSDAKFTDTTYTLDVGGPSNESIVLKSGSSTVSTVYVPRAALADKAAYIDTSASIGTENVPTYVAATGLLTACGFHVFTGTVAANSQVDLNLKFGLVVFGRISTSSTPSMSFIDQWGGKKDYYTNTTHVISVVTSGTTVRVKNNGSTIANYIAIGSTVT